MRLLSTYTGAAPIAYQIKRTGLLQKPWKLRWKPVCGSTESELASWIHAKPFTRNIPRVFLSGKQIYGRGQRGRVWVSPKGGVWLSAAMPLETSMNSVGLFGLAVAVSLSRRFESSCIPVQIKWPNDLLVHHRKIAGFLPRIIYRGNDPKLMWIGIGLNVSNRVPLGAISLSEIVEIKDRSLEKWTVEILFAIETALLRMMHPKTLCEDAEQLLWAKQVKQFDSDEMWEIEGLDLDGRLKVRKGFLKSTWSRW